MSGLSRITALMSGVPLLTGSRRASGALDDAVRDVGDAGRLDRADLLDL
jgi:hypothetical protein